MSYQGDGIAGNDTLDDARRRALRAEYVGRINRVIDHIEANLAGDLSLTVLAGVAAFSPYHFHRVFKAVVGENLSTFIRRRRVEKAASLLLANPARPITSVALECGFASPAAFAKVFRESFGTSASDWLRAGGKPRSKDDETESNHGQWMRKPGGADAHTVRMLDLVTGTWSWRLAMDTGEAKIEVKNVPEMNVAYLRHIGPYAGDEALFERLIGRLYSWASPRGLVGPDSRLMSIYQDDPDVTDEANLRLDVALTVPPGTAPGGEIGTRTIPAATYAVGHFELQSDQYTEAWQMMMGQWLPESGYQPSDGPCLEIYLNDPGAHPEGKHIVELYVPVKPL